MLDLKKLLDMQKELDKTILDNAGIKEYPLENIKLALLVELGELANEWKGFKHWKKDKAINRDNLLEEFADCLSFALSLENELHQTTQDDIDYYISYINDRGDIPNDIMTFNLLGEYNSILKMEDVLSTVIINGLWLGITPNEMEYAYYAKNKVNYDRQNNGY